MAVKNFFKTYTKSQQNRCKDGNTETQKYKKIVKSTRNLQEFCDKKSSRRQI